MNPIRYILLICLAVCVMPAYALKANEASGEKYLQDHGHSGEVVRMVELQKSRLEGNKPEHKEFKKPNRFVSFFRNLFYERDVTLPLDNFGQDDVRTVESPDR